MNDSDLLAVQRAHADHGRDVALAEIRRRWPMIAENVIEQTLTRILAAPVESPARFSESGRPVLDHRRRAMRPRR